MRIISNINNENYKSQSRTALFGALSEFPNLVLSLISAIFSNTLLVWSDTFLSMGSTSHYMLVFFVAHRLRKETGDKYNFGTDRVEVLTSFISEIIIGAGYLVFVVISVYGLFNPSKPDDALFYFIILKGLNIAFDIYFFVRQTGIYAKQKNRMNRTELDSCRNNLLIDVITGVIVVVCYFFREIRWSWYISPAATLIMAVIFGCQSIVKIREAISDLLDTSIPIKNQDEIYDIVLEHKGLFDRIDAVNCRMLNYRLYVEIHLTFKKDVTYKEMTELLDEIHTDVIKKYPNSVVRFVSESEHR